MKSKPNLDGFTRPIRDPDEFLEGGTADVASRKKSAPDAPPAEAVDAVRPEPTTQKLFRLRWDVANALKLGAAHQSVASGRRVTETEIVEQLIKEKFKL